MIHFLWLQGLEGSFETLKSGEDLNEEWFDYIEVDDEYGNHSFMLPVESKSFNEVVHFDPGYKYFIRIIAEDNFVSEPDIELRLVGQQTTSIVLKDYDLVEKAYKELV